MVLGMVFGRRGSSREPAGNKLESLAVMLPDGSLSLGLGYKTDEGDSGNGEPKPHIESRKSTQVLEAEYSGEVAMLFRSKSPLYSGIMRHPPVGA